MHQDGRTNLPEGSSDSPQSRYDNTFPGDDCNEVDHSHRRRAVLLCHRHPGDGRPRLLRPREHVLRTGPDVLRSGSGPHLLRSGALVLRSPVVQFLQ